MFKYLAVLLLAGLSACGMKGSLEMPPGPAPEPLLGYPKPAKPTNKPANPAKPATEDVSTDKKQSPQ